MANPSAYSYSPPLVGFENAPLLPNKKDADDSSIIRGAFDVHVYYFQANETRKKFAQEQWERIRREFPELRIYTFWDRPIGPHPVALFEVNLFTPAQFGAFIPWWVINRGPLSTLIRPNTINPESGKHEEEDRDHTQRATWMGDRLPLDLSNFKKRKS